MQRPQTLAPGDTIQIVAPSRWVSESLLEEATSIIEAKGYKARFSENISLKNGQFAGEDSLRAEDFIKAWKDKEVKALWIARGGYGAQRIVDAISKKLASPQLKWVIGFSDCTAIHAALSNKNICSIHGPVISTVRQTEEEDVAEIFRMLAGETPGDMILHGCEWNSTGRASGRLVGGNLSVLQTMIGTASMPVDEGDVLFIEDVDEMLYHLDRMMLHLKRSGVLGRISGLLVGGMTDMRDNTLEHGFSQDNPYGKRAYDIIIEHCNSLSIPMAFGLPCGHGNRNRPLLMGASVDMNVNASGVRIAYR